MAVVAESSIPTVQSLIRWDPVAHADAELAARTEVGLPPSVHMAALDGTADAVTALLRGQTAALPVTVADVLGPVELPPGVRRPAGIAADVDGHPDAGAGAPRPGSGAGGARCGAAIGVLSARANHEPVRVQIDPLHIG